MTDWLCVVMRLCVVLRLCVCVRAGCTAASLWGHHQADSADWTPLLQACANGHEVIARLLVEKKGVDVNQVNVSETCVRAGTL
jgi:hypothetical protein